MCASVIKTHSYPITNTKSNLHLDVGKLRSPAPTKDFPGNKQDKKKHITSFRKKYGLLFDKRILPTETCA